MSRPDLERTAADGYRVAAYYRPNLRAPATAIVVVTRDGLAVDVLETAAADGLATWRHAGALLPRYRALLAPSTAPAEVLP